MSGMLMSVITGSYGPRGSSRSASKPLVASDTSASGTPSSASMVLRTNERVLAESSTTRILGIGVRIAERSPLRERSFAREPCVDDEEKTLGPLPPRAF